MKVYRIDAVQLDANGNLAGMVTVFSDMADDAHVTSAEFEARGWLCESYLEEAEISEEEADYLILSDPPWPTLPIDELVVLAKWAARGKMPALLERRDVDDRWEPAAAELREPVMATNYDDTPEGE